MPRALEHYEQRTLMAWAHAQSGWIPELDLLFAIPNGGQRSKAVAGKLRAEGVKAGVPDLLLPVARGGFHGLFIEMKAPSTIGPDGRKRAGRETAEQKAWGERLRAEGYRVVVCWGFEEARAEIMQYLDVK